MYIKFQQNRVCISVKTVHTNLFATNSNFEKIDYLRHASSQNVNVFFFLVLKKKKKKKKLKKSCTLIYLQKWQVANLFTNSNFEEINSIRHASS